MTGFEPATSRSQSECSTKLSYIPRWSKRNIPQGYNRVLPYIFVGMIGLRPEGKVLKTLPNHSLTTPRKIPVVEVGITANGKGGIRTHGSFHFAGFQDQSLQPLDHLSMMYIVYNKKGGFVNPPSVLAVSYQKVHLRPALVP